jgi:Protein of unknown function (DUF3489)
MNVLIAASAATRRDQRMKTYAIDQRTNRITLHPLPQTSLGNAESFSTEAGLAEISAAWPMSRLVAIWNQLPGVTRIRKFTSRKNAVTRIWRVLQKSDDVLALNAAESFASCDLALSRRVTTTSAIVALLQRDGGATLDAIRIATGWQSHSVRGFLSGTDLATFCTPLLHG